MLMLLVHYGQDSIELIHWIMFGAWTGIIYETLLIIYDNLDIYLVFSNLLLKFDIIIMHCLDSGVWTWHYWIRISMKNVIFNSKCVYLYLLYSPIFSRSFPLFFPIRLKLFALLPRRFIANSESGNIGWYINQICTFHGSKKNRL